MTQEVDERFAKLADPEFHCQTLANDFRKKLAEAKKAYDECLKYGLAGYFYIGPSLAPTHMPDSVVFKKTKVTTY